MSPAPIRHWLDLGAGPPLVLIHGWGASGEFFAAQQALVKRGLRVIIPDLPGHGPTATRDPHLSIADLGAALAEFLHTRALDRPVLVGWSMGLLVALEALTRHDVRAAGLAILDMTPKVANAPDWSYGIASRQTAAEMRATADAMEAGWADFAPRIAWSLFARG
ncbi:alpha/beta fold hydrolase, partial [Elstera litoralis]|uniref:alpha/beta fold hydrolase n=1 Tax=Elstera litoralis TaxID=552518 RepID=UPI000AA86CC2